MRRFLIATLLAASGCAVPAAEPRIPDNDPLAAWYSSEGPYTRGETRVGRDCDDAVDSRWQDRRR